MVNKTGKYLCSTVGMFPETRFADSLTDVRRIIGKTWKGNYKVFTVREGKIIQINLAGRRRK